ncbi:hypothetical protein Agub_g11284 [Astrephomene gubernaculifera]|uniref:dCTP pyrophosphatase 1 n=1 Tax=Astrephomene gubernaculifera TaxID=47775 RepID=A0AAD3DY01_9CHLO|nr:hypothetical protein Agub_g11284 [Astrephomene gubernaculifera]
MADDSGRTIPAHDPTLSQNCVTAASGVCKPADPPLQTLSPDTKRQRIEAPNPRTAHQQDTGGPQQSAGPRPGWSDVSLESLRGQLEDFARQRDWEQYHTPRNLLLALVGEAGELAELFQWRREGEAARGLPGFTAPQRTAVAEELADVLLYLVRLADACGVDLGRAALSKMAKNAVKYPAERCRGSSAKYTAYDLRQQKEEEEEAQQQPEEEEGGKEEEQKQQEQEGEKEQLKQEQE